MVILKIVAVSLSMGGTKVLNGLNLSVEEGSIHAILGPNAAGKSSLAYLIMGCREYMAQEGRIYFNGKDISQAPITERAKMGLTLAWQEPARFEGLTVRDYIAAGMNSADNGLIEESLHYVSLDPADYLDRKVDKTLSGGERKRIELASIFAMQPKLAVLDEPDSGIDIIALDNIIDIIKELRNRGTTVLVITHRERVAEIADKTSLMCSGFIVTEGLTGDVTDYFKHKCIPCPTKAYSASANKIT